MFLSPLCGHFSLIEGIICCSIDSLCLALLLTETGFVTIVSRVGLCLLVLTASTLWMNGHIPIFPSNRHSPFALYLGLAILAHKNITLLDNVVSVVTWPVWHFLISWCWNMYCIIETIKHEMIRLKLFTSIEYSVQQVLWNQFRFLGTINPHTKQL